MKSSDVAWFERHLTFHLAEILEKLKSDSEGDADGDSVWSAKWGSSAKILRECLLTSRDEITSALTRIQEGTYGDCIRCGNEIDQRRLQVVPWSKFCIVCQEESERGQRSEGTQRSCRYEISS